MSDRQEMIQEVAKLIKGMDIPGRRKTIAKNEDLRWLKRSLPERNTGHPNYKKAMEILKELI